MGIRAQGEPALRLDDWFLTPAERGNPVTAIDRRRARRNRVDGRQRRHRARRRGRVLPRGSTTPCSPPDAGDTVHFTDWQGDGDELLDGPGSAVGELFAAAARRGVHVRGLLWRSHPRQAHFAEQSNAAIAKLVNAAGGEVVLDERVRRGGSHHQKLVVFHGRDADDDFAFAGGIDLCHGRRDDARHRGDPQAIELDDRYGPTPPWHDVQLEVHGPAVGDLGFTFRERWEDPTPLDHRNPWRLAAAPRHPRAAPSRSAASGTAATRAAGLARGAGHPHVSGEASTVSVRAGRRTQHRPRVSQGVPPRAPARLHRGPVPVVAACGAGTRERAAQPTRTACRRGGTPLSRPRWPGDAAPRRASARARAIEIAPPRRWRSCSRCTTSRTSTGTPIYVHAKVCVIDDVLLVIGSDNLNRRSWTHDSEVSCAVIDAEVDDAHRPTRAASATTLVASHARRGCGSGASTSDAKTATTPTCSTRSTAFAALARAATDLDRWHRAGRRGPRPPGHLRVHQPERVSRWAHVPAAALYRAVLDPDGRPRRLRHAGSF